MPVYEIYINTVKASAKDVRELNENLKQKKDSIKRIVIFKNYVRIYTV